MKADDVVDRAVKVLMVSAGGYGHYYLKTLLEEFPPGAVDLVGVVEPYPDGAPLLQEIRERGIPVFLDIEDFFAPGHEAELAVIASPMQFHVQQSIIALEQGCHVLVEKPVSVTVQETDRLAGVAESAERWVMVGFQWSYSRAIQGLKEAVLRGDFGAPVRGKTLCCWPRDDAYYRRSNWAGCAKDTDGAWILDSPALNGMGHFLHNLLYLLGNETGRSAVPATVMTECYRINPIQNYDTVAARIITDRKVELLFYASHATEHDAGPVFQIEFEWAVVTYSRESGISARMRDGEIRQFGSPEDDSQFLKLFEAVEMVRKPKPIICGIPAVRPQVLCVNGLQEAIRDIGSFPEEMIKRDERERRWWVDGLEEDLLACYSKGVLPQELGFYWAQKPGSFNMTDYREFPSRKQSAV